VVDVRGVPDVLVLGAGGIVGEAWMTGVLAGIEDGAGIDLRDVEAFVGTSAGSMVAARLAAGERPRRPEAGAAGEAGAQGDAGEDAERGATRGDADAAGDEAHRRAAPDAAARVLSAALRWGWAASAPLAPVATALAAPGGALLRSALLTRAPDGGRRLSRLHAEMEALGTRFDGRLRVCAVDKRSGRRVIFGAPGAPTASIADAVTASCSIPWVFAPVRIGERDYVDGGVWSVTNLDAAPARRDTQVLCLDPTAVLRSPLRQALRVAVTAELQILRVRGARVRHVAPDEDAAAAMGTDFMASAAVADALVEGYRQGRTLTSTAADSGA
jgi:NTE family protein